MSFGQELKEFTAGFATGWKMVQKPKETLAERQEREAKAAFETGASGDAPDTSQIGAAPAAPLPAARTRGAGALPAFASGMNEVEAVTRMTMLEASKDPNEQQGVAAVMRNRSVASGRPIVAELFRPGQFEPVMTEAGRQKFRAIDTNSPEYQRTRALVAPVLAGEVDPTYGATYFYAPAAQRALGRKPPKWDDGTGTDIGRTRFFKRKYAEGVLPVDEEEMVPTAFAARGGVIPEWETNESGRDWVTPSGQVLRTPEDEMPRRAWQDPPPEGAPLPPARPALAGASAREWVDPTSEAPVRRAALATEAAPARRVASERPAPLPPTRPDAIEVEAAAPTGPQPNQHGEGHDLMVGYDPIPFLDQSRTKRSVASAMDYIQRPFAGGDAALPQADPRRQVALEEFASNKGAATPEEVNEIKRTVDPRRKLTEPQRMLAGLNAVHDYWIAKGEPEKAQRAAASMMMYTKKVLQTGGSLMQAALEDGRLSPAERMQRAAKIGSEAYESVPSHDNIEILNAGPKGATIRMVDDDGNITSEGKITADQMLRTAVGMQDGTVWMQQASRTQAEKTASARQKQADARLELDTRKADDRYEYGQEQLEVHRKGLEQSAARTAAAAERAEKGEAERAKAAEAKAEAAAKKFSRAEVTEADESLQEIWTSRAAKPKDAGADWEAPPLPGPKRVAWTNLAVGISRDNDMTPAQAAHIAVDATNPDGVMTRTEDGRFQIGDYPPVKLSPVAVNEIARLRGANSKGKTRAPVPAPGAGVPSVAPSNRRGADIAVDPVTGRQTDNAANKASTQTPGSSAGGTQSALPARTWPQFLPTPGVSLRREERRRALSVDR